MSTTIGSLLGELVSGQVSDKVLYLANKRKGGLAEPESRLHATWPGAFILPAGVVIEGVCLQFRTHWIGPVMGIGIGAFGLQIVSTTVFAYLTDCYKPQSAEISTLLNFGRLTFSFTLGFYMVSLAHKKYTKLDADFERTYRFRLLRKLLMVLLGLLLLLLRLCSTLV